MTCWFRLDNRLVHGQIIEAWLPYLAAEQLVVVNDDLAGDELQQQIMRLAIPERIHVQFIAVADANVKYEELQFAANGPPSLFLFGNCRDVARMVEQGVPVPVLNVGNMHYAQGKRQLSPHVAVSEDDLLCFDFLKQAGTRLDFRAIPGDVSVVEVEW